jgi:hypothetical protein
VGKRSLEPTGPSPIIYPEKYRGERREEKEGGEEEMREIRTVVLKKPL